jgi:hypothetical protein
VSAKKRPLTAVLLILAVVAVFLLVMWLMVWNEPDSGTPLQPPPMEQPSTN